MEVMTDDQLKLVGRTFRHFKMRLSPTAIRLADERSEELLHGKSHKSPRNLYRLEGFAKDSETLEEMAVYRALYGERGMWVRPAKMFFETIQRDGKTMKRFELVEDGGQA